MFKQLKDAKKAVEAAPGLVDQAMQMGAQPTPSASPEPRRVPTRLVPPDRSGAGS